MFHKAQTSAIVTCRNPNHQKFPILALSQFGMIQFQHFTVQWNVEIRTTEIRTMPKSEQMIVQTDLVQILVVHFIRSLGFRTFTLTLPLKCQNRNVQTVWFRRPKSKHFGSDFGILLVRTEFGTERLSPVRNPN